LTTYVGVNTGGDGGSIIVPGDPDASRLIEVQTGDHFGLLNADVLAVVRQWIADGTPQQ